MSPPPQRKRPKQACGKCPACTHQNCRKCKFCLDMKCYGGPAKLKRKCIERARCPYADVGNAPLFRIERGHYGNWKENSEAAADDAPRPSKTTSSYEMDAEETETEVAPYNRTNTRQSRAERAAKRSKIMSDERPRRAASAPPRPSQSPKLMVNGVPVKRGRGRPRKSDAVVYPHQKLNQTSQNPNKRDDPSARRGRGRPRKVEQDYLHRNRQMRNNMEKLLAAQQQKHANRPLNYSYATRGNGMTTRMSTSRISNLPKLDAEESPPLWLFYWSVGDPIGNV